MSTDGVTNAHLTADAVVFNTQGAEPARVLLIQRADDSDTYPGAWALPGGYLKIGELPEDAVRRELGEETGLWIPVHEFVELGWYAHPLRDPRGRVVSFAFVAGIEGPRPPVRGGDDAKTARWAPLTDVLNGLVDLAFDHQLIIDEAYEWIGVHPDPSLTEPRNRRATTPR